MDTVEKAGEEAKEDNARSVQQISNPGLKDAGAVPDYGWAQLSRHSIDTRSKTADKDRQSQEKAFRDKLIFSYIILAISALWAVPVVAGYYWWEKLLGLLLK